MQVQLGEILASVHCVEQIVHIWETCLIVDCDFIQLAPVTYQAQGAIFLLDKEDRGSIRRLAGLDKTSFKEN